MDNISDYFKKDDTLFPGKGLTFYVFDDTKATAFVMDCLIPFRQAYIDDEKLNERVMVYGTQRADEIQEQLPNPGDVMSGDFGEILAFYMACGIWESGVNVAPMKWRLKDKKKASSHYTDLVLFKLPDVNNPSVTDAMVTYEVKTRATSLTNTKYKKHKSPKYKTYKDDKLECTIIEAVFDAQKDAVERAAETIPYLLTRCKDERWDDLYHKIYRFSKANKVSYIKEHNAVAVVDIDTLNEQITRMPADLLTQHPDVNKVYCVPMKNLKNIYEHVYSNMPMHA